MMTDDEAIARHRKALRAWVDAKRDSELIQVTRAMLLELLQAADRADYAEGELKNCQAMNGPLGDSCVRSQAAEAEAKQALALARAFIPFPMDTFKEFREEYDAAVSSLDEQRPKADKLNAELARKTAELVHVIKVKNACQAAIGEIKKHAAQEKANFYAQAPKVTPEYGAEVNTLEYVVSVIDDKLSSLEDEDDEDVR